jgi:SAM-dependent methyltransferase
VIEIDERRHATTLVPLRPTSALPDPGSPSVSRVQGYGESSYGDGFADVYDEWYHGVSDIDATVTALVELAGDGPVLELGVGTGRLALPLAERGLDVHGVDSSAAMLDRLVAKDSKGAVRPTLGDMVDDLPSGPFSLAFVAYNTLFNLTDRQRQADCFDSVASRLRPGGRFVVEAFVPDEPPREGNDVSVRSLTATNVVLSVTVQRPELQVVEGQFVEISESGGIRLRPWSIRYSAPGELDDMARHAGFGLEHRWESFADRRFHPDSPRHVSVYRLRAG